MDREKVRTAARAAKSSRWRRRLMIYLLAAALVFLTGVLLGGILSQHGQAESAVWLALEDPMAAPSFSREAGMGEDMFLPDKTLLSMPCIDQRDKYPTGCESVSAVMALQRAGVEVSVEEFIDTYLPKAGLPAHDGNGNYYSADPAEAFLGDPYSEDGWGCYAPALKGAIESLLKDKAPELAVEDLTGRSLTELYELYVCQGRPVVVWATMGMTAPRYGASLTLEGSGDKLDWITPEHCLVLVGADKYSYYFNDPLEGDTVAYGKQETKRAYEALGSQALAIKQGR